MVMFKYGIIDDDTLKIQNNHPLASTVKNQYINIFARQLCENLIFSLLHN